MNCSSCNIKYGIHPPSRFLRKPLCLFISGLLLTGGALAGETIVYDGDTSVLQGHGYKTNTLAPKKFPETEKTGNTVTLNKADGIVKEVYGAYHKEGGSDNTVYIKDNSRMLSSVTGAYIGYKGVSKNKLVKGNKVVVEKGIIASSMQGDVSGGATHIYRTYGSAIDNEVVVGTTGGKDADIYIKEVRGGQAAALKAEDNAHSASENKVFIHSGIVSAVVGGLAGSPNKGGAGNVRNNSVTITGGKIKEHAKYSKSTISGVYGGRTGQGHATENKVYVSNAEIDYSVYGGFNAKSGGRAFKTKVNNNMVSISNTPVKGLQGVFGGYNRGGMANANTVTLKSAQVEKNVFGGWSQAAPSDGRANDNKITIDSGGVQGSVYGGLVRSNLAKKPDATTTAKNNTIIIKGNPKFNADPKKGTVIYGGYAENNMGDRGGEGDYFTGNVLEIHSAGLTARNISNIEKLRFYLPDSVKNNDKILTLTDGADTNIEKSKIGVGIAGGAVPLQAGEKVALIHRSSDTGKLLADVNLKNEITGMKGVSTIYKFDLSKDDKNLYATVKAAPDKPKPESKPESKPEQPVKTRAGAGTLNAQTKALSEGRLSAVALLNSAGDELVSRTLPTIAQQTGGLSFFGQAGGGKSRHQTGSHIDVNGSHLLLGAAGNMQSGATHFALGGFFEAGDGKYDTFNSFIDGTETIHGNGKNRYYGLGVFGRATFANKIYAEASLRAGRIKNDFSADFVGGGVTQRAGFSMSKNYQGAHLGLGYAHSLSSGAVEPYAHFLWTRQQGGDYNILGDVYKFADIESKRSRLGLRYTHNIGEQAHVKVGAAWDYEFDGRARASVNNMQIAVPELKGSSGVVELGFGFQPKKQAGFSFDVGLQGHVGKRRGVTGNVGVKYSF